MNFLSTFVLSLIFMCQAVGVMALPIPPAFERAPHLEAPSVFVLEMGFNSIFTMALLFSFLGAYMMKFMGGTRAPAFMARLSRTSKHPSTLRTLSHCHISPYRRCHTTPDYQSRGTQRRIPVRRGRISAPMATVPRQLGSAFDSPCPSSIVITVTCGLWSRDKRRMTSPSKSPSHILCYLTLFKLCPWRHDIIRSAPFFISLFLRFFLSPKLTR
ncbi:hypothetical protein EDB87DRAFT_1617142 [Lactarius vividus]|nr:hypothetical protein EDB87DRAFT_1617142 [Lactarius vividus]